MRIFAQNNFMKHFVIALFIMLIISFSTGFYIKNSGNNLIGDRIVGISVLVSSFVFLPLFLYHRRNKTKLKDFQDFKNKIEENLKKGDGI